MKIKEKYQRLLYAIEQFKDWEQYRFNSKTFKQLLKRYPYWNGLIYFHCCKGWQENCWIDIIGDGIWDYTYKTVNKEIFSILNKPFYKKHLKKFPMSCRYRILNKGSEEECIEIFVTFRDMESELCTDYLFTGYVNSEYDIL